MERQKIFKLVWNETCHFLIKNWKIVLFFAFLAFLIFTNQIHESYPDEFENILGGKFILQGRLPYSGFFTHHNPFAYFFSSLILLFSGISFVKFRLLLGLSYLIASLSFYLYVTKSFVHVSKVLIFFYLYVFLGATYFWGHMLLADSLSAYLITACYIFVFLKSFKGQSFSKSDILFVSIVSSFALLTSSALVFYIAIIYIYLFLLIWLKEGINVKKFSVVLLILLIPYFLFAAYLLLSNSYRDFYRYAIRYNTDVYVQFPDGASFRNPFRLAIVYLRKFTESYRSALVMVKDLNFSNPVFQTFALGNLSLIVCLLFSRQYSLSLFVFLVMVYSSLRGGGPLSAGEKDYQSMHYYLISLFNSIFALYCFWKSIAKVKLDLAKRVVYSLLLILLGTYMFFLLYLFFDKWFEKTYLKYMGKQSLIYDRPPVANLLNEVLDRDDYYFIGPFDFEDQFYLRSKPASRYIVVLNGMDFVPSIQNEIIEDLSKARPKVIVFNTSFYFFNGNIPAGRFLSGFLRDNYLNFRDMKLLDKGFTYKYSSLGQFDFDSNIFILKSDSDELLSKFVRSGYLIPPSFEN